MMSNQMVENNTATGNCGKWSLFFARESDTSTRKIDSSNAWKKETEEADERTKQKSPYWFHTMLSMIAMLTIVGFLVFVAAVFTDPCMTDDINKELYSEGREPTASRALDGNDNRNLASTAETYHHLAAHGQLTTPSIRMSEGPRDRIDGNFNRDLRDKPHKQFNEQRDVHESYLASIETTPRLGRSPTSVRQKPINGNQQRATEPDDERLKQIGDLDSGEGEVFHIIASADLRHHQQNEAINIDKIKGIEASPNDIKKLKTDMIHSGDDLMASESAFSSRYKNLKCNSNRFDLMISRKFDEKNLSRPIITSDGRFDNPFSTWSQQSIIDLFKFVTLESDESNVPKSKQELDKELPFMKPDFLSGNSEDFRATWIGHSTLLIQVDGMNILTDPIFSERASPSQYFGPKRIRKPAWEIKRLPRIHAVLISHNHYDHLDTDSVQELNQRFGTKCRWIVPLGLGTFMEAMSVGNYIELDWWQKDCFKIGRISMSNQGNRSRVIKAANDLETLVENSANLADLSIYLTPSQHWSRRGLNDFNKSLWGSYTIVNRRGATFLFGGDTAYCSAFKEIGEVFGPFTGAAIPIGAYKPRWFLKTSHVDPNEAVQIHRDLKSLKSISIHHSTFILSSENYKEPAIMLNGIMETLKLNNTVKEPFISLKHGETTLFSNNLI